MDKIILDGLTFYAFHGVSAQERDLGHRFEVVVELSLDLKRAGGDDDIQQTVDYQEVYRQIEEVVMTTKRKLLESVAENIAAAVLTNRLVEKVRVRVCKRYPPIAGHIDSAGVEIVRKRDE